MKLDPFALIAAVREQRALRCRPGSEQEIGWHALVPAPLRALDAVQTPAPTPSTSAPATPPPAAADPTQAAESVPKPS